MAEKVVPAKKQEAMQAAWTKDAVAVKALHVMLLPDEGGWFAQGLEIDYTACGPTQDEAKKNFAEGLGMTVCKHLEMFGDIKKVLVPATKQAWEEYYKTPADKISKQTLSLVAFLTKNTAETKPEIERVRKVFPFDTVEFIKGEAVTA